MLFVREIKKYSSMKTFHYTAITYLTTYKSLYVI